MPRRLKPIGACNAVTGLVVFLAVAMPYANEVIQVDRCLDTGGSYDYVDFTCDHLQSHQFLPYSQRHPLAAPAAAVGLGLAAVGALLLVRASQRQRRELPATSFDRRRSDAGPR